MNKPFRDSRLVKELVIVLALKVIVLTVIWHCYFDAPIEVNTPETIADKLFSNSAKQGETF